ncbi:hypothetical protein CROQUDRAFT_93877 [Cronartium quercuum f. sp. fusiforme G11]|uniref:Uncharacterized protein n=1 Tax=Cronartium quercuum f. sp. fusiforme G11 TaxID=708437 RepID=A0A9P6NKT7_9BASI|nr:hypothetical protein CROQUDRAFT_93877 [Cronartium quercuum f. sp. fusiforme G11]
MTPARAPGKEKAFGSFRYPEAPKALAMRSPAASEGPKLLRRLYGGPPKIGG